MIERAKEILRLAALRLRWWLAEQGCEHHWIDGTCMRCGKEVAVPVGRNPWREAAEREAEKSTARTRCKQRRGTQ